MNFNEIDPSTYDKYTFGKCVRTQREEQGLSLRNVASQMGFSVVYLSDVERGNKYALGKVEDLLKLAKLLNVRSEDIKSFIDMANASRGYYEDLKDYINENENVRIFMRYARDMHLTNDEWHSLINYLEYVKSQRGTR